MTGTSSKNPERRFPDRSACSRSVNRLAGLLFGLSGLLHGCSAPIPERIVLVTIDTLRADHVGCYGREKARTATLDGLCREGVRFDAALSPVPLTLPAHTSLMTALDPPRHGVRHNSIFTLGPEHPTLAERMQASGRATAAFMGSLVLHSRFGLARGFDVYDEQMGGGRSGVVGFAERKADQVVDAALAWLGTAPQRFFLWVHLYDPHAAYDPPMAYAVSFASSPYDGEIAFTDAQLGRLLRAVDERYGAEGTLVVVTSDHGESLGEHGEPSHSYSLYDATQRIPLLMKGPGLRPGQVVAPPVRLVDLAPTLLASTGLPPLPDVDGRDLRPVMEGSEREPRLAYMETLATQLDFGWSPLFALRDARSKYIRAPRPELYDVAADPKELENRAAKEPERIASLDAALAERLSRAVALAQPATLSAAERARLESLGYVVPGPTDVARAAAGSTGIDPKDGAPTLAAMTRASQLLEAGRAGEALSLLRPLSDGGPHLLALRASAALDAGFPAEAESDARAVLAQGSARDDVLVILGDALLLQRRAGEAQSVYAQARAVAPESGRPRVGLARVAEAEGNRGAAIAGFRAAYDLERAAEASGDAAWRLAALLLESGQLAEADALLAGLPGAATRSQPAVLRLAAAELAAGRTAAAVGRLEAALAEHAESAALQSASGIAYEQAGRWDDSLAARERALALAPDEPAAQNDLAWALARTGGDLDRALALAERAQRAAPRAFEPVDTLAAVRLRRREPAAALAGIEEAVAAGTPAVPILELRRAQALESLGRKSEARRALALAAVGLGSAGAPSAAEGRALASKLGAPWPTD